MTFDEQPDDSRYADELEDRFREVMLNNVAAKRGYDAAKSFGMTEEQRLKAAVIQLADLNNRAMAIIVDAVMHGMPITKEVADVRNKIVGSRGPVDDP